MNKDIDVILKMLSESDKRIFELGYILGRSEEMEKSIKYFKDLTKK